MDQALILSRIVKIVDESSDEDVMGSDDASERDLRAFDEIRELLRDEGLIKL